MSQPAQRVLVTGANKGIGLAIVRAILSSRDDTFVLLGSRSAERGRASRDELVREQPGWAERVADVPLDVADEASVRRAAEAVATRFGREPAPLSAVVNNAGVGLGAPSMRAILEVNTWGVRRVVEAFLPLLAHDGRIVNVSSAAGPVFLAACSPERRRLLTNPAVTWAQIEALMHECLDIAASNGDFAHAGLGDGSGYGISKACLNAYTMLLARSHPSLCVNAFTPGFIETDLTRPYADSRGITPAQAGMKPPEAATHAALHLLFGDVGGSGWYFGSDAQRSPLDRYRSPGAPPYTGD